MSVEYTAMSILGCVFPRECWYVTESKTHAEFSGHATTAARFCPECGQLNTITQVHMPRFPLPDFCDLADEWPGEGENMRLGSFQFHWSTDNEFVAVGKVVRADDQRPIFLALDDIATVRGALEETLKPYGLWEETRFGLWAILYVSY